MMAGTAFLRKPFASIALASVRLATGALKDGRVRNRLHVVCDGAEATDFPWTSTSPKRTGGSSPGDQSRRETQVHPVVILTTPRAAADVLLSFQLQANA